MSDNNINNDSYLALDDVVKGKSDWRQYRSLLLPNGITCVVVNDKESKTTAMAVTVGVGASFDPKELSGLAHFTEHMCFLGSEAYPGENEYKQYLSRHGGRSNASTSMSHTTYHFEIVAKHADHAVDIFSNFFVSPLFTQDGTSRELNAVDSENSKNLTNDGRRRLQILKALADPLHHYSKFSTGNAQTLSSAADSLNITGSKNVNRNITDTSQGKNKTREALLAFHRQHYRPNNMTVVIVGPQTLDTLQEWVAPRFAAIADRDEKPRDSMTDIEKLIDDAASDAPKDSFGEATPAYNPAFKPELQGGSWPVLLTTLPLRSVRKLILNFPLPSVRSIPDKSPFHLICHLLGHEGPGSPFAILQDANLLDSLSAGQRLSAADQSLLQITMSLTLKGERNWESVAAAIFYYCRIICKTATMAHQEISTVEMKSHTRSHYEKLCKTWEEVCVRNTMNFQHTSPGQVYSFAPNLASSIRMNGTKMALSAGSLLNEGKDSLPLDELLDFASRLIPENCIVERCSEAAWDNVINISSEDKSKNSPFGLKKEKWYGIEYHLSHINRSVLTEWNGDQIKYVASPCQDEGFALHMDKMHLPSANPYIPCNLNLCSDLPKEATLGPRIEKNIHPPELLVSDDAYGRLWHRLDDRYCLPKAHLNFMIRNTAAEHIWDETTKSWIFDSDASMRSAMITSIFTDALAQETYDASLAGLHFSLSKSSSGFSLHCWGYSHHLTKFATNLLERFLVPQDKNFEATKATAPFLQENYVQSNKDRVVRYLASYLLSNRADEHASYYTNLLLSSRGNGIDGSLAAAKSISLDSLREHHMNVISHKSTKLECFLTGNVSRKDATTFFSRACELMSSARNQFGKTCEENEEVKTNLSNSWIPGPLERKLFRGEDICLHFQSKNLEEQNGAVRMTFQSSIPGYKGELLSTPASLERTASMRLIAHILKEPLFNRLRTKQQLGYIVNSHYDISFSAAEYEQRQAAIGPSYSAIFPVESIIVNVLSRKLCPQDVMQRIDDFLISFRETLG